jgi:uncharacterized membrane protein SirB2
MLLKHIHVTSVAASYTLFFLRGIWTMRNSPVMQQRWIRIAPHVVDTVLLGSAILLAWQMGISPFHAPWLLAKIVALLIFVGLGFVAIDYGRTQRTRLIFWMLAQGVFFYIVVVALTKDVMPWTKLFNGASG